MNDIPRYKASMPMQKVFVTNADKCGDHIFTQVERSGRLAVYRRNRVSDGRTMGYEVITIKTVKAGTVFAKGTKPVENDYESYPGAESFGRSAWSYVQEDAAFKRFDEKVIENTLTSR